VEQLGSRRIDYTFGKLTDYTNKMTAIFANVLEQTAVRPTSITVSTLTAAADLLY
jgi:hypothetical protein